MVDVDSLEVKFPEDYYLAENVKPDFLEAALKEGYVREQKIDGKDYIRLTEKYFEELGKYIKENPRELCLGYWNRLVNDTAGCNIMDFVKRLCYTHGLIKRITDNEVDFCEQIGEELNG